MIKINFKFLLMFFVVAVFVMQGVSAIEVYGSSKPEIANPFWVGQIDNDGSCGNGNSLSIAETNYFNGHYVFDEQPGQGDCQFLESEVGDYREGCLVMAEEEDEDARGTDDCGYGRVPYNFIFFGAGDLDKYSRFEYTRTDGDGNAICLLQGWHWAVPGSSDSYICGDDGIWYECNEDFENKIILSVNDVFVCELQGDGQYLWKETSCSLLGGSCTDSVNVGTGRQYSEIPVSIGICEIFDSNPFVGYVCAKEGSCGDGTCNYGETENNCFEDCSSATSAPPEVYGCREWVTNLPLSGQGGDATATEICELNGFDKATYGRRCSSDGGSVLRLPDPYTNSECNAGADSYADCFSFFDCGGSSSNGVFWDELYCEINLLPGQSCPSATRPGTCISAEGLCADASNPGYADTLTGTCNPGETCVTCRQGASWDSARKTCVRSCSSLGGNCGVDSAGGSVVQNQNNCRIGEQCIVCNAGYQWDVFATKCDPSCSGEAGECSIDADCCNSVRDGGDMYCSDGETGNNLEKGCCPSGWYYDEISRTCEEAFTCGSACPTNPSDPSYWTNPGCVLGYPLNSLESCCTVNRFGVIDNFYTEIDVYNNENEIASSGDVCEKAVLCDGGHEIECSSSSDGVCPVLYGDWSVCKLNPASYLSRCSVCDPDCIGKEEIAGNRVLPSCGTIRFVDFPDNCIVSEPLTITVETDNPAGTEIRLTKMPIVDGGEVGRKVCDSEPCQVIFTIEDHDLISCPDEHGESYRFKADLVFSPSEKIEARGFSSPYVSITQPVQNQEVSGTVLISAEASSKAGIEKIEYYLEREISPGVFQKVNPGCSVCDSKECNKFGESSLNLNEVSDSKIWDAGSCGSGNHRLTVIVDDGEGTAEDSVIVVNDNPVCTSVSCIFVSDVVDIIRTKVKVWT